MPDNNGNHISKVVRFRIEIESTSSPRPYTPHLARSLSSVNASELSLAPGSCSQGNVSLDVASSPRPAPVLGYDVSRDGLKRPEAHIFPIVDPHEVPIACNVTLVQDKGAYSMLKIIHQRMQECWR